jgi:hypothetical protein
MKNYALVKDGIIFNIAVFEDDASDDLFEHIKQINGADEIVLADGHPAAAIDGTWDGTKFTTKDGLVDEDWDLSQLPSQMLTELRTILGS